MTYVSTIYAVSWTNMAPRQPIFQARLHDGTSGWTDYPSCATEKTMNSYLQQGLIRQVSSNHLCQGLNSHYFHIIGDGHQPNSVGVYIPIIRIPIKGGMTIPNIATLDHGTSHDFASKCRHHLKWEHHSDDVMCSPATCERMWQSWGSRQMLRGCGPASCAAIRQDIGNCNTATLHFVATWSSCLPIF